jgi:hypothetical protein
MIGPFTRGELLFMLAWAAICLVAAVLWPNLFSGPPCP